jgi:hypothetical protein
MFLKVGYHWRNYLRAGISPAIRKAGPVMFMVWNGCGNVLSQQHETKPMANIDSSFAMVMTATFQQTSSGTALQIVSFCFSYLHIAPI